MAEETDIQWCGNDSQQPKIIAAERKSRNANIGWYAIQFQKAGSPLTHALPGAHMFGGFEFSPEHTGESSDVVARPTHDYLIGPDAALTILQSAKRRSVCVFGFNVQSENASVKPIVEIVCHLENDCKSRIVVTSDRFVGMSTVNSIASIHIRNKNPPRPANVQTGFVSIAEIKTKADTAKKQSAASATESETHAKLSQILSVATQVAKTQATLADNIDKMTHKQTALLDDMQNVSVQAKHTSDFLLSALVPPTKL